MISYLSSFVWPAAQPADDGPPPAPPSLSASPPKRQVGDGDDEGSDESVMAAIKWNETLDGAYLRLHALHGKPTGSTVGEFTQAVAGTSNSQWYGRSGFWKKHGLGDAPAEDRMLYAKLANSPRVEKKGRGGTKRSRKKGETEEDVAAGRPGKKSAVVSTSNCGAGDGKITGKFSKEEDVRYLSLLREHGQPKNIRKAVPNAAKVEFLAAFNYRCEKSVIAHVNVFAQHIDGSWHNKAA